MRQNTHKWQTYGMLRKEKEKRIWSLFQRCLFLYNIWDGHWNRSSWGAMNRECLLEYFQRFSRLHREFLEDGNKGGVFNSGLALRKQRKEKQNTY